YPRQSAGGLPAAYAIQGATGVATDATTNRVQATFAGFDPFTQTQSGINSMNIQFGGLAGPNRGRDACIDDNIFAATESPTNPWLAGVPTSTADIASLAGQAVTGNYSGSAFGSVFNNGSSYLAAGNFNGQYNFATQTGSVAITNFDGRNFSSPVGPAPLSGNV